MKKKSKNLSKNNNYFFSIKCEGKNELIFINNLKSEIFHKNKTLSYCKNKSHSKLIGGTININHLQNTNNCCHSFIVIDKDNLNDNNIGKLKDKAIKENVELIITYPCFEIILLSLFIEISIYEKEKIESKLASILNCNEYKHTIENIKKLFNKAFSSETQTQKTLEIFEHNLYILNKNKKSNFIVLYKLLKGEN